MVTASSAELFHQSSDQYILIRNADFFADILAVKAPLSLQSTWVKNFPSTRTETSNTLLATSYDKNKERNSSLAGTNSCSLYKQTIKNLCWWSIQCELPAGFKCNFRNLIVVYLRNGWIKVLTSVFVVWQSVPTFDVPISLYVFKWHRHKVHLLAEMI